MLRNHCLLVMWYCGRSTTISRPAPEPLPEAIPYSVSNTRPVPSISRVIDMMSNDANTSNTPKESPSNVTDQSDAPNAPPAVPEVDTQVADSEPPAKKSTVTSMPASSAPDTPWI